MGAAPHSQAECQQDKKGSLYASADDIREAEGGPAIRQCPGTRLQEAGDAMSELPAWGAIAFVRSYSGHAPAQFANSLAV